jgi:hypothetical protein
MRQVALLPAAQFSFLSWYRRCDKPGQHASRVPLWDGMHCRVLWSHCFCDKSFQSFTANECKVELIGMHFNLLQAGVHSCTLLYVLPQVP